MAQTITDAELEEMDLVMDAMLLLKPRVLAHLMQIKMCGTSTDMALLILKDRYGVEATNAYVTWLSATIRH